MKNLYTTVLEGMRIQGTSDPNGPQPNTLYVFWTAKIQTDKTEWMNGICADSILYDEAHKRVMKPAKFQEIARRDLGGEIMNLVKEKYPYADVRLFFDVIPTQQFAKKQQIIWKNCYERKTTPECVLPLTSGKKDLEAWEKAAEKEYEKIEAEMQAEEERKAAEAEKQKAKEEESRKFWEKINSYKNLGYMNSWTTTPLTGEDKQKYDRADDVVEIKIGRGHYLCYSNKEQIKWYVDSTD